MTTAPLMRLVAPRPPLPDRRPRGSTTAPVPRRSARRPPRARRRSRARPRAPRSRRPARRPRSRSRRRAVRWSSAGVPRATIRPRVRMATRSQTSSTSLSRCELSTTATPRSRSSPSRSRTMRRPTGSSALVGSSSISSFGSPTSAWAIPSRCCMPFDIAPTLVSRASASPTSSSSSARSPRPASRARERLVQGDQLVGREPVRKAEQLGEVADRAPRAGGARGRPSTCAPPLDALTRPQAIFVSVDLPAPFGPSRPRSSPGSTSRSTPSSASFAP